MRIPLLAFKAIIAIVVLLIVTNNRSFAQSRVHHIKKPSPVLNNFAQSPVVTQKIKHGKAAARLTSCAYSGPFFVSTTGSDGNCGSSADPFLTIQHAIDIAVDNDIINIDGGTYTEQLDISKSIILSGSGSSTVVQSPNNLAVAFTTSRDHRPVIYVHNTLTAGIKNLTVDGAGKGNANYSFEGITFYNAGGGISDCKVTGIRNEPIDGLQSGDAVYALNTDEVSRSIIIQRNAIDDFQKNGITTIGSGLNVTIASNIITGAGEVDFIAQNGIEVADNASGNIIKNKITGISYTPADYVACGILIYGSGSVNTTQDTVTDVQAGILYYQAGGTINKNVLTNDNLILTDYWWAIDVEDGTATVSQNEINNGGNGVGIEADALSGESTELTVLNNKVNNSDEGIVIYNPDGDQITFTANYNSITNNATNAIHNYGNVTQNATCNWFGTNNDADIGLIVEGQVTYTPFLFSGTDINPNVPGFQPTSSCSQSFSVTLASKTNVSCHGSNTGAIDINVTGGSGIYLYSWSNGKTKQDLTNIVAGTYTVTVTDKKYGNTASLSEEITEPSVLVLSLSGKTNPNCNGDNSGSFTVNASGGTPPYLYSLNGGGFASQNAFINRPAATYNVVVKDDHGCTKAINVKLTEPPPFVMTLLSKKDIRCHGNSTGVIKVSVSGGITPLGNYILTGPVSLSNRSGSFNNLPEGNYTVTRTDAHNCIASITETLTEPLSGCSNTLSEDIADSKIPPAGVFEAVLSPNPSVTEFTLSIKSNSNNIIIIRVVDMFGKTVFRKQGSANQSYHFGQQFIDGIYSIQIIQGTTVKTIKAVKGK